MTCDHWKPGEDLPPAIGGMLRGLVKACTDEGIPLSKLFAHADLRAPEAIQNRDYADARVDAMTYAGFESVPRMFYFLQKRLIEFRARIEAMTRAHNIQVDMFGEVAAERNKLLERVKYLEREHWKQGGDPEVTRIIRGEDEM